MKEYDDWWDKNLFPKNMLIIKTAGEGEDKAREPQSPRNKQRILALENKGTFAD